MLRRHNGDEVILTGRPEDVSALLAKAAGRGHNVNQDRSVQNTHGSKQIRSGVVRASSNAGQSGQHGQQGEAMDILAKVAREERLNVAVEPNCTVGNPFRQELNPWEWDLNPWEWDLNPWEWDLNPDIPRVISVGSGSADAAATFWSQPAFQAIGLTDQAGQRRSSLTGRKGDGVLVGIFDALPSKPVSQSWLTLHPTAVPLSSSNVGSQRDLSDHGLMCASLVNAVAPNATVHLYEVCTKDGYGTLYPLVEALSSFISMAAGQPAVISLSLGTLCCGSPSPALQAVLHQATDRGMVVCAAAGNKGKSAAKVCTLPPAQVPASLPNVIAVAASSLSGERATYSQRGDIAAPGGEDLGPHGPGDADDIIGLGVSVGTTGYVAMDAGTSFSTPLVAGAAALVLQAKVAGGAVLSAGTFSEVLSSLVSSAQPVLLSTGETLHNAGLGAGILNLNGLLA